MAKKQTSSKISSLSAKHFTITGGKIFNLARSGCDRLATDIRAICGSNLSQDETPKKNGFSKTLPPRPARKR